MSLSEHDVLDSAIDRGLDHLVGLQLGSGEMPSSASPLDGAGNPVDGGWTPDTLKFITALVVLALAEIPDPRAIAITDSAVQFLRRERETMAQWRYWSSDNEQFDLTPPDADDTACCSMAVAVRGDDTRANHTMLLANRDEQGRFYTWLIPRGRVASPRVVWGLRDEYRSIVRERRQHLWDTTEAWPDDVDGVVNTNVIRYLGPRSPREAVEYVCSIIDTFTEDTCDSWHRDRYTLYASIADASRRGVTAFDRLGATIVERITDALDDGAPDNPLDLAAAMLALQHFDRGGDGADAQGVGEGGTNRRAARDRLVAQQRPDGGWEQSIFYYGGPREVFGWASEALSTATAVQALHREAVRRSFGGAPT